MQEERLDSIERLEQFLEGTAGVTPRVRGGEAERQAHTRRVLKRFNYQLLAYRAPEFSKMDDILEFLDSTDFSLEEKLHHLEQIKKKYKALQTQASRQGTQQTNLSLSATARAQLDQLAKRGRMSKTEVIELLIQGAHERGLLN